MVGWASVVETVLQTLLKLGTFALGWFAAKRKRELEEARYVTKARTIEAGIALSGPVSNDELRKQRNLLFSGKTPSGK